MTDAPEKFAIQRDRELEQAMLRAIIGDRNDQPRTKQVAVGPSSIGFCRELLRAQLFESDKPEVVAEENYWATAAHVGQTMGAELERIMHARLGAGTQYRCTTFFPMLGVSISGAIDLLLPDAVVDLKSMDDVGSLIYDLDKNASIIETLLSIWRDGQLFSKLIETPDGEYELTERVLRGFSKLHYWIQVAIYVTGCIQAGVLPEDAEGRLVWYDRSGEFQELVAVVLDVEVVQMMFDIGQHRVMQVVQAQELYEASGNPALLFQLRDQAPSFCFSPKVMCPLRNRCWGGYNSEAEQNIIDSPELIAAANRYVEGRRLRKIGDGMTKSARDAWKGINGTTSDGVRVGWAGNTINVVDLSTQGEKSSARSAVDIAADSMAKVAIEPPAPTVEVPPAVEERAELVHQVAEAMEVPEEILERDPRIERVAFVDTDPRPKLSAEEVLATAPELTPAQQAYLERVKGRDPVKERLDNLQAGVAADKAARAKARRS